MSCLRQEIAQEQVIKPVCEKNSNCERGVCNTGNDYETGNEPVLTSTGNDAMITKTRFLRNAKGCEMKRWKI